MALARAIDTAAAVGRIDLVEGLKRQRDRLDSEAFRVLVAGEFGRGKSALVNALVGAPVCGVSARSATAVPTFVRYGPRPVARIVPSATDPSATDRLATGPMVTPVADAGPVGIGRQVRSIEVPVADVPHLTLRQEDERYGRYGGVEVELSRQLLSDGLILVDSAGLGGGFGAAAAATTLRALSGADALLLVTDASAELSASELEFMTAALSLCPVAACIVSKIDLYPRWRRIVELDRAHLAEAQLDIPVLPVSSVLQELAIDTTDGALRAESGFPVLTRMLTDDIRRGHRSARCRVAVEEARSALRMVMTQLQAEQQSLRDPAGRQRQLDELRAAEQHAARMYGASARWQEVLTDELRTLRREVPRDLEDRFRKVRDATRQRIAEGTRDDEWAELDAWLVRFVNQVALAHHHVVLKRVQAAAAAIAAQFDTEIEKLPFSVPQQPTVVPPGGPSSRPEAGVSRIEIALVAARGFTLGGSVLGGLLSVGHLSTLAAGGAIAIVSFPVMAAVAATTGVVAGATFTARAVRTARLTSLHKAQLEVQQGADAYLLQAQTAARRLDDDLLDLAFVNLRDHFKELSVRMLASARAAVTAASGAGRLEQGDARAREQALADRLDDVNALSGVLDSALAAAEGRPA